MKFFTFRYNYRFFTKIIFIKISIVFINLAKRSLRSFLLKLNLVLPNNYSFNHLSLQFIQSVSMILGSFRVHLNFYNTIKSQTLKI